MISVTYVADIVDGADASSRSQVQAELQLVPFVGTMDVACAMDDACADLSALAADSPPQRGRKSVVAMSSHCDIDDACADLLALAAITPPARERESAVAMSCLSDIDAAWADLVAVTPSTPPAREQQSVVPISAHGWKSQTRIASLALLASKSPLPSKYGQISRMLPKAKRRPRPTKKGKNVKPKVKNVKDKCSGVKPKVNKVKDKCNGVNSKPEVNKVKDKSNGVNTTPKPKVKTVKQNVDGDTPQTKPLRMDRHAVVSRAYKRVFHVATKVEGQPKALAAEKAREAHHLAGIAWDQEQV